MRLIDCWSYSMSTKNFTRIPRPAPLQMRRGFLASAQIRRGFKAPRRGLRREPPSPPPPPALARPAGSAADAHPHPAAGCRTLPAGWRRAPPPGNGPIVRGGADGLRLGFPLRFYGRSTLVSDMMGSGWDSNFALMDTLRLMCWGRDSNFAFMYSLR